MLTDKIPQKLLTFLRRNPSLQELPAESTFADVLDALTAQGYRWGMSIDPDGRYVFAVPTDNPYKHLRNSSADADRCLTLGITRLLKNEKK